MLLKNCYYVIVIVASKTIIVPCHVQAFTNELTPHQRDVTEVNQKGNILVERCRPEDGDLISAELEEVNQKWDDLLKRCNGRQHSLEEALLQLGQFQMALEELLVWIRRTNATLDEELGKKVQGDVRFIEVELAKHRVSSVTRHLQRDRVAIFGGDGGGGIHATVMDVKKKLVHKCQNEHGN